MLSRAIFLLSLSPPYFFFLTPRRRLFPPPLELSRGNVWPWAELTIEMIVRSNGALSFDSVNQGCVGDRKS